MKFTLGMMYFEAIPCKDQTELTTVSASCTTTSAVSFYNPAEGRLGSSIASDMDPFA